MCRSKVGRRKVNPSPIPPDVKADYERFVRRILDDTGKGVIRLDVDADRLRMDYERAFSVNHYERAFSVNRDAEKGNI